MRSIGGLFVVALIAGLSAPWHAVGQSLQVIPPSGRWVTDQGAFLSAAEERSLSMRLATYADTTSTQIIIVTLQTLNGVPVSEYAVALGRAWRVGQAGYNNGVVILASRDDRQMFIATGYGLEGAIPDAVASRIYRNILVPNFRQGRFYDGLSQAVDALVLAAAGEFDAVPVDRDGRGLNVALVVVLLILIVFIIIALRDARRDNDGNGFEPPRRRSRYSEPPVIIWGGHGSGRRGGGMSGGGFGGFGGGGFGGFGGGGGSFGGGGAGGGW